MSDDDEWCATIGEQEDEWYACDTAIVDDSMPQLTETGDTESLNERSLVCPFWDLSNPLFVNHAELAWHEMRRAWVGDGSETSHTKFRQPILSWTTSFEDLLSSGETFPDPIPLADVVDLLVDIWIEEGLYN
ncbi:unnamed protein product [Lactuca virosa]|uniref:Gag1-like clamp domain-containing protein n=1 Tax=Lactuca virosa TaxID=75947 RepID=A0AAU9NKC6_9ASTR|nr:unnamed protein product [Lactuca virosa]